MLHKTAALALSALLIAGIFGCAGTDSLDSNWGRSFDTARFNQTLNPDADGNLAPVEGLEGPAADRVMGGYIKGAGEAKKQTPVMSVYSLQK
jgi:hypothetical protein